MEMMTRNVTAIGARTPVAEIKPAEPSSFARARPHRRTLGAGLALDGRPRPGASWMSADT